MYGQNLTEAICRNLKSQVRAVLSEIDQDLLTGLVSIPSVIRFPVQGNTLLRTSRWKMLWRLPMFKHRVMKLRFQDSFQDSFSFLLHVCVQYYMECSLVKSINGTGNYVAILFAWS